MNWPRRVRLATVAISFGLWPFIWADPSIDLVARLVFCWLTVMMGVDTWNELSRAAPNKGKGHE